MTVNCHALPAIPLHSLVLASPGLGIGSGVRVIHSRPVGGGVTVAPSRHVTARPVTHRSAESPRSRLAVTVTSSVWRRVPPVRANSSCFVVCKSSYNFTVSGGPNSSLIKVYILD